MSIKSLLFFLFLYVCLGWVGAAYLYSGPQLRQAGLLWTGVGLLALLLFLLIARLVGWLRARKAAAVAAPVKRPAPTEPVHEDDAAMRAILAEANTALAKVPAFANAPGGNAFYTLPMYLLIGPQDTGKSTTLLNSGIEPLPLAGQGSGPAAAGSTRLCVIWLVRDAIFVEIAGRVFSGGTDRWAKTLRILRGEAPVSRWRALQGKSAPTANLRGVVAFCDAKEFTSAAADPQRFERFSKTFQDRLRTIGEVFGSQFPVYHVTAKADTIPYFSDFFQHLPELEAAQVLGCTLPLAMAGAGQATIPPAESQAHRLTTCFRQLYHSLAERRIIHLAHEPDLRRRPGVYEFPRELKRIRTPLVQFLTDVFRPNPLVPGPVLRGYYLTGVREVEVAEGADPRRSDWTPTPSMESTKLFRTAEATQLFRAADATQLFRAGDVAKGRAAAASNRLVQRWMFATELFQGVVLADRMPIAHPSAPRPFDRERRIAFVGVCAVSAFLCAAFGISWWQNRQLIDRVETVVDRAAQNRQNVATMADLEILDNLRTEIVSLRQGASLSYHWGLYSGERMLPTAREVYFRRFQQLLLNDLNGDLVARMRAGAGNSDPTQYDPVYRALKAHLMITSGACQPDTAAVAQALKEARQHIMPAAGPEWRTRADRQIDFYASEFAYGNPCRVSEDAGARDSARDYLRRVKGVDRIYNAMLASAEPNVAKTQRLSDIAPNYKQVLNGPAEVGLVYSRAAWDPVQKAAKDAGSGSVGESCVVGGGESRGSILDSGLQGTLRGMYISNYIDQWRKYVGGFSVVRYSSAGDAARKLDTLSGHSSPLLALFFLAGNQTNFATAAETGLLDKALERIGKSAGKAKSQVDALSAKEPSGPAQITNAFQPVQWVVPPGSDSWIVDKNAAYIDGLAQLGHAMQAIAQSPTPDPAVHQAAEQAYEKAMEASRQISRGFRPSGVDGLDVAVQRLLDEPIQYAKPFIHLDLTKDFGDKVNSDLRAFCASARPLFRRFPFQPVPAEEASLEDFAAMFAPETGAVWKFQAQALADLTVKDGQTWKAKDPAKKPQVSPEMLDFLNHAQALTNAFFPPGAARPQLTYSLRPKLDPSFKDATLELELDGASYPWTSSLRKQFSWPSPAGTKGLGAVARIVSGPVSAAFASEGGVWGIFKVMADAEPRAPNASVVEWKSTRGTGGRLEPIKPAPVRMEIVDFPGGVDVFNPKTYAAIGCPVKAVQ